MEDKHKPSMSELDKSKARAVAKFLAIFMIPSPMLTLAIESEVLGNLDSPLAMGEYLVRMLNDIEAKELLSIHEREADNDKHAGLTD